VTCIVGFKAKDGELWLGADNRVSRWYENLKSRMVYVDEVQKLYFPRGNVVVAVATEDIGNVQSAIRKVLQQARVRSLDPQHPRSIHKYEQSLARLVDRLASQIDKRTQFLVGIRALCCPANNRLLRYDICQRDFSRQEVNPGECSVAGSVRNEPEFGRFQNEVLSVAFGSSELTLCQRDAIFRARLVDFQSSLVKPWTSVGEMFVSACTNGDHIAILASEVVTVTQQSGLKLAVQLDWNDVECRFVQRQVLTGETVPLIGLENYRLSIVPGRSRLFRVTQTA
jgi:hypothetical protein